MTFKVRRRATLLIPSGPQGDLQRKHLFVVMCDPTEQGDVLLVSIATYHEGQANQDNSCLLEEGEHLFIKRTSYVKYSAARQQVVSDLEKRTADGFYTEQEMINEKAFQRILKGFHSSRFTKQFVFKYLPKPNPLYD